MAEPNGGRMAHDAMLPTMKQEAMVDRTDAQPQDETSESLGTVGQRKRQDPPDHDDHGLQRHDQDPNNNNNNKKKRKRFSSFLTSAIGSAVQHSSEEETKHVSSPESTKGILVMPQPNGRLPQRRDEEQIMIPAPMARPLDSQSDSGPPSVHHQPKETAPQAQATHMDQTGDEPPRPLLQPTIVDTQGAVMPPEQKQPSQAEPVVQPQEEHATTPPPISIVPTMQHQQYPMMMPQQQQGMMMPQQQQDMMMPQQQQDMMMPQQQGMMMPLQPGPMMNWQQSHMRMTPPQQIHYMQPGMMMRPMMPPGMMVGPNQMPMQHPGGMPQQVPMQQHGRMMSQQRPMQPPQTMQQQPGMASPPSQQTPMVQPQVPMPAVQAQMMTNPSFSKPEQPLVEPEQQQPRRQPDPPGGALINGGFVPEPDYVAAQQNAAQINSMIMQQCSIGSMDQQQMFAYMQSMQAMNPGMEPYYMPQPGTAAPSVSQQGCFPGEQYGMPPGTAERLQMISYLEQQTRRDVEQLRASGQPVDETTVAFAGQEGAAAGHSVTEPHVVAAAPGTCLSTHKTKGRTSAARVPPTAVGQGRRGSSAGLPLSKQRQRDEQRSREREAREKLVELEIERKRAAGQLGPLDIDNVKLPPLAEDGAAPHYTERTDSMPLGIEQDHNWLTEFQCFIRHDLIEVVRATRSVDSLTGMALADTGKEDENGVSDRGNTETFDQVGIRCRYCAHLHPGQRASRASAFPSSIRQLYQSFTMMLRDHFEQCTEIAVARKALFVKLKHKNSQGAYDSKQYWVYAAEKRGLVDSPNGNGIRISKESIARANEKPPFGTCPGQAPPGPPVALVRQEDSQIGSDFLMALFSLCQKVHLLDSERVGKRRTLKAGLPGIGCIYCAKVGRGGMSRMFPLRRRMVPDKVLEIYDHCTRCPLLPEDKRQELQGLHQSDLISPEQEKEWYDRIWVRLNSTEAAASPAKSVS